jgi:hypothetical protein
VQKGEHAFQPLPVSQALKKFMATSAIGVISGVSLSI